MQRRTQERSVTEPTHVVNGDGRISRLTTSCPELLNVRTNASPRWPELPVTKIFMIAVVWSMTGSSAPPSRPLGAALAGLDFVAEELGEGEIDDDHLVFVAHAQVAPAAAGWAGAQEALGVLGRGLVDAQRLTAFRAAERR
jgi:hypothetical protein